MKSRATPEKDNELIKTIFNRCSLFLSSKGVLPLGARRSLLFNDEGDLPVWIVQKLMIARGKNVTFTTIDDDKLRAQGTLASFDKSRKTIADGIVRIAAAKHGEILP